MRIPFLGLMASSLLLTSLSLNAQENTNLFVQDSLKRVGSGFVFTEGCSPDRDGNVFFTDQPNDKVWKYSTDGKMTVFMEKSGRANGTYFDKKGNLILCADENGQLWSVTKSGKVTVILDNISGKQPNGPNDIWLDAKGGIYFTDPYYQRPYWTRTKPDIATQDTYYLPKGSKAAVLVADSLKQPNGIVGSADGRYLFISDIAAGKTYKYAIGKAGALTEKKLLIQRGSDGMTVDAAGNIYLTGNDGVHIYDPSGLLLGLIKVPRGASNVCFWGKNKNQLFITAKDAVYSIPMRVRGVE